MLVLTTQAVWVTVCDCWFCLENCLESYIKLLNNFLIVCFWKGILGFISSGLKMIKNDVFKTFFCVFIVEKKPKKWCQSNMNMTIDRFWGSYYVSVEKFWFGPLVRPPSPRKVKISKFLFLNVEPSKFDMTLIFGPWIHITWQILVRSPRLARPGPGKV